MVRLLAASLVLIALVPGGPAAARGAPAPAADSPAATLEALWKALVEHYPMKEYVGAHGDQWLEEYRPLVAAAPSRDAAFSLMEELVARFNDYHTGLAWPGQVAPSSLPLRVEPVLRVRPGSTAAAMKDAAFQPFVAAPAELGTVSPYALAVVAAAPKTGLLAGDELTAIDGVPVEAAARRAWKRARGSSRLAKLREGARRLLEWPSSTAEAPALARIQVRRGTRIVEVEIPRGTGLGEPLVSAREVAGVPVVRIARWADGEDQRLVPAVDALLERYRSRPGLVIDVRGNGGGSDSLADEVTGRFLERPVIGSISFHRNTPTVEFRRTVEMTAPRGPWRYAGRVAVLIDEGCRSACEHFVSGMIGAGAVTVGSATDGACGWIRTVELPGDARLRVSRTFPLHAGGLPSPLQGMRAEIYVPRTLPDLRAGRDAALEAAVASVRAVRARPHP